MEVVITKRGYDFMRGFHIFFLWKSLWKKSKNPLDLGRENFEKKIKK